MRILVTGGYGFIGSTFVKLAVHAGHEISIVDKMTYAADSGNIEKKIADQCEFTELDISDTSALTGYLLKKRKFDYIVNFAAESHVDRSIDNGLPFVQSNILGVVNLLEHIKNNRDIKFLQVSTDEVYGSIENGSWNEESPLEPRSPYSASKASAELFCNAYRNTHELQIITTRCANNFGPNQSAEKLIPTVIRNAIANKPVPVYGDGLNRREWIYVEDHAIAILKIIQKIQNAHNVYNVGGWEMTNLDLVRMILGGLGKDESLIEFVKDRPGHDFRYSVDSTRYKLEFGEIANNFEASMKRTIDWYLSNMDWLIRSEVRAVK